MTGIIHVFTDGSAAPTNPGPAGWAWWVDDERWDCGFLGTSTNNVAELTAIAEAVKAVPPMLDLLIRCDSQYAIKCLSPNGWLRGWQRKNWRTATGKPVQNRALIEATAEAIERRRGTVGFQWVRGHRGVHGNVQADRLANKCAMRRADGFGPGW